MDVSITSSPETIAVVTFFCVGMVKFIDELFKKDFLGAAKIAGSTIVGALLALAVPDLSVFAGAAIGLNASGLMTTLGFVSGKVSLSAPSVTVTSTPVDGEVVA